NGCGAGGSPSVEVLVKTGSRAEPGATTGRGLVDRSQGANISRAATAGLRGRTRVGSGGRAGAAVLGRLDRLGAQAYGAPQGSVAGRVHHRPVQAVVARAAEPRLTRSSANGGLAHRSGRGSRARLRLLIKEVGGAWVSEVGWCLAAGRRGGVP